MEEDNPFLYCEHENLLARVDSHIGSSVHAENSTKQTNNLKTYKISQTLLSRKLEKFDNDCYALKNLIRESIKSIFKHSIKNYGMEQDVETLFKQVKNLRSNSLIYITQCYLNPICQDLDGAVKINVYISEKRKYMITLHPKKI